MIDKNEKNIKDIEFSEENLDNSSKNDISKEQLISTNNGQDNLFISEKMKEENSKAEIEKKEISKTEIKQELKTTDDNSKAEIEKKEISKTEIKQELKTTDDKSKAEIEKKEISKTEIKQELKTTDDKSKAEIEKKEISKTEIKQEFTSNLKKNELDTENKVIKTNSDTNKIPIEKSKVKPKKEIPIEKKPFNEFINEHLIPEIVNEFKIRGKVIDVINIKKTNRPISEDICWVIYCEVQETCNFWLSFEKDDITSLKSFSLCKNYEKPSIIESFLIDEKKITLKLIISRILQRLNGQKLIGAN